MRKRTYPISSIDEGINATLENVKRLLDFATKLDDEGNKDYSYVFYSFAVEEFGKAILLNRNKQLNVEKFTDTTTFSCHKEKVRVAVEELNNRWIAIPVYKELEPTSEITVENGEIVIKGSLTFQEMEQVGEYLNVDNRLDIIYVDYNERTTKWQTWKDKQLPMGSRMRDSLAALKLGVREWAETNGFHIS